MSLLATPEETKKMERPNVPKFGNWDKEEVVPYTAYFDNARKGRGGKRMINPNDPEENPELFQDMSRQTSHHTTPSRKTSMDDTSAHSNHQGSNNNTTRPSRASAGSEHNIDRSPLHPHYRAKAAGVSSPARDSKSPLHGSQGNRTPGRTRMKPVASKDHRNEDRGGAPIPRFGDWDDNDPESAENFTHIFNVASVEKQTGSSNTPPPAYSDPSYNKTPKQKPHDQGCCFGWFRK